MPSNITNAMLAQKVSDLLDLWKGRELEMVDWISGAADGGPYGDGRFPLTTYLGVTRYTKSPAALETSVNISALAAQVSANIAGDALITIQTIQTAVENARAAAQGYQTSAQTYSSASAESAAAAAASASDAAASAALVEDAADSSALAIAAAAAAQMSATNSSTSASSASTSAGSAAASASTASTKAADASSSAGSASTSATNAATSASTATTKASEASASAAAALASANDAAASEAAVDADATSATASASSASTSAATATTKASEASASATSASTSETNAATSATNAASSASSASTSATTATTKASEASTSATAAATSATNAASSAASVASSAAAAASAADDSADSATASAASAASASTSAGSAASSASAASSSASASSTSASSSAASAAAAAASAVAAEAAIYGADVYTKGESDSLYRPYDDYIYDEDIYSLSWSKITGITGTPTGSKYLRDDGSWNLVTVLGTITSGVWNGTAIGVGYGGTGITSYTTGNYINAASSSSLQQRTPAQVLSDIGAAASSHTHAASDITSGLLAAARIATGTPNGTKFLRDDQTWQSVPNPTFANPSNSIGLTANNGSAGTYKRSDATDALDQGIAPTWTASHKFTSSGVANPAIELNCNVPVMAIVDADAAADNKLWFFGANGTFTIQTVNDAKSVAGVALEVTRSGTAVSSVILGNTTHTPLISIKGWLQNTTTLGAGVYSTQFLGASGAARDILMAGQSGFSNGFTVQFDGTQMKYTFNSGNAVIGAPSSGTPLTVNTSTSETVRSVSDTAFVSFYNNANSTRSGYLQIPSSAGASLTVEVNQSLTLGTNAAARMLIAAAGNVTINAPSSGIPLSVSGASSGGLSIYTPGGFIGSQAWQANSTSFGTAATSYNAIYSKNTNTLGIATTGLDRMEVNASGNVAIYAPASGVGLTATGVANAFAAKFVGSSTSGQSRGLQVNAGTTSADYALNVTNQANTVDFMSIFGDGHFGLGYNGNGFTLSASALGGVTIITPGTSTVGLTVNGAPNTFTEHVVGNTSTSQSYGLLVSAGTNSSDQVFQLRNQAGSSTFVTVAGNGTATFYGSVLKASAGSFLSHGSSSYASGTITVSSSAPSGGADGDVWLQV